MQLAPTFGRSNARAKGTIALRALRKPSVATLKRVFSQPHTDRIKVQLAEQAELQGLLHLLAHENAKIIVLAQAAVAGLDELDDGSVGIVTPQGYASMRELILFNDKDVQIEALGTLGILAEHRDFAEHIVANVGWDVLATLLRKSEDADVLQAVILLIANLACFATHMEHIMKDEVLLRQVIELAGNGRTPAVQRASLSVLVNLASAGENVPGLIEAGVLSMLTARIQQHSDDASLLTSALLALANIARSADGDIKKQAVASAGGVPALVNIIKSHNTHAVQHAVTMVIAHLAAVEDIAVEFARAGLVDRLIAIGRASRTQELDLAIAIALNNFAQAEAIRDDLKNNGEVIALLRTLAKEPSPEVANEASEALEELGVAKEDTPSPAVIAESPPAVPVAGDDEELDVIEGEAKVKKIKVETEEEKAAEHSLLVSVGAPLIQTSPAESTAPPSAAANDRKAQLIRQQSKRIKVQGGGEIEFAVDYEAIIAKLKSNNGTKVKEALDLLVLLCNKQDRISEIGQWGVIPHLIELLSADDPARHSIILGIIARLASDTENVEILRANGVVPICLAFTKLSTGDNKDKEALKVAALQVLTVMCVNNSKTQNTLRDAKAVPSFVAMATSPQVAVEIRAAAISTLGALSKANRKLQQVMKKEGVVQFLVSTLADSSAHKELRKNAAGALSEMVDSESPNQTEVLKCKGAANHVHALVASGDEELVMVGLALVKALAKDHAKWQTALREAALFDAVAPLLLHSSIRVQQGAFLAALELIRDSARNVDALITAGSANIFNAITAGLESRFKSIQYYSAGCIWAVLSHRPGLKEAFMNAGAVDKLCSIIATTPVQTLRSGAKFALEKIDKNRAAKVYEEWAKREKRKMAQIK